MDNACEIRIVLLVQWVVGLYRDSRGGAIIAALDAGKDSRRYGVSVLLNKFVLGFGHKSLLVSRLRRRANWSNHLLDELNTHLLTSTLAHGQGHV